MGRTAQILVIKTLYILYNIYVYLDPSIEVSPLHMHCFKLLNSGPSTSQAMPGLALVSPGVRPAVASGGSGVRHTRSSAAMQPRELKFGMNSTYRG